MRNDVTIDRSRWKEEAVLVLARGDRDDRVVIDRSYALTKENMALLLAILEAQPGASACENEIDQTKVDELSRTERRVLRYLPTNLSRPAIARELYVSVNTVNTHIRNIYSKLDATSRAEAVDRARLLRLIAQ